MSEGDENEAETSVDPPHVRVRERRPARITGDRYRIGTQLGRGGMGEVLAARDEQIGREVAIKRIRAEAPNDRTIERFLREARIQGRLEHPAIVPVHEIGRDVDGLPYFAMKKLAGVTLGQMLEVGGAPRQRMLRCFVDICLAIEFAHVHGIVHRDLKPTNFMLGDFGEVYVLDWGVAKIVGETDDVDPAFADSGEGLTASGVAVGTPGYMSPKQAQGAADVDARADVYALGRVLEEMLGTDVPPELADLCRRATALDRSVRVKTARELADTVQRYLDGDRDVAHRRDLARDQVTRARSALAAGTGDGERRDAMNAAGRALALDPENADAGAIIAQLVFETPKVSPREVETALAQDAFEWVDNAIRVAMIGQLVLLPVLATMAVAGMYRLLAALCVFMIGALAFDQIIVRGKRFVPKPWTVALLYAPLLGILSYAFSPPLAATGIAAVVAVNLCAHPGRRGKAGTVAVFVILAAPVLATFALGEVGVLHRSIVLAPQGVTLFAPALDVGSSAPLLLPLYTLLLLGGAMAIGGGMRRTELRLRKQLHTISWHLQQLLPR